MIHRYVAKILTRLTLTSLTVITVSSAAQAIIIQADTTASIAGSPTFGNHFHRTPSASPGNALDLNGHSSGDITRAVSLFDLTALGTAASATLRFDVSGFTIGNALQRYDMVSFTDTSGAIELSDFQAGPTSLQFAAFNPTGNPTAAIDVTAIFNANIGAVLGLRLQPNFVGQSGVTDDHFNVSNFRIETTATAVPEPNVLALLGLGLAGFGLASRHRSRKTTHSAAI